MKKEKFIVSYTYTNDDNKKFKFFNNFSDAYRFYKSIFIECKVCHITYIVRFL